MLCDNHLHLSGEDIGLKDIKRVSLYIKLVNLKTKWTQLDFGCHQKIIQIELNVLSIKEYALLQWLVEVSTDHITWLTDQDLSYAQIVASAIF